VIGVSASAENIALWLTERLGEPRCLGGLLRAVEVWETPECSARIER
jgi:hypothetical protein